MVVPVLCEPTPACLALRAVAAPAPSTLQTAEGVTTTAGFLLLSFAGLDDLPADVSFAPLFESTTDAVALVEFGSEAPVVRRVNEQFAEAFAAADVVDSRLDDVFDLSDVDADERASFLDRARRGESFRTRLARSTPRGKREFVVRVVPATEREATTLSFLVFTDVTDRENRAFLDRLLRHHLLNGLNLVQARLDLLGRPDGEGEEHVRTIERRVSEMIDRVRTTRALRRILAGDADRQLEAVDLEPIVAEQVDATRDVHRTADVRVDSVPDVAVRGDRLLGEVLDNLLRNAVQHNDADDPVIRLSGTRSGDVVRLRVADNGSGVDDERKERIFERGVTSLDDESHGLGLYLVREVVDVYGGGVRVEDSDLGGAAFVLDLPLAED